MASEPKRRIYTEGAEDTEFTEKRKAEGEVEYQLWHDPSVPQRQKAPLLRSG